MENFGIVAVILFFMTVSSSAGTNVTNQPIFNQSSGSVSDNNITNTTQYTETFEFDDVNMLFDFQQENANSLIVPDVELQKWYYNNSPSIERYNLVSNSDISGYRAALDGYPDIWLRDTYYGVEGSMYIRDDRNFFMNAIRFFLSRMDDDGTLHNKYNFNTGLIKENENDGRFLDLQNQIVYMTYAYWIKTNDTDFVRSVWSQLQKAHNKIKFFDSFDAKNNLIDSPSNIESEVGDAPSGQPIDNDNGYLTSSFILASKQMTEMSLALGDVDSANLYQSWINDSINSMNNFMWSDSIGYRGFRVSKNYWDTDKTTFTVTSSIAMIAGVPNQSQKNRIYRVIYDVKNATPSDRGLITLYPASINPGFSDCEKVHYYIYQNGGDWIWWDSVVMQALYENGYSDLAYSLISAIRTDVRTGVYGIEWRSTYNDVGDYSKDSKILINNANNYFRKVIVEELFGITSKQAGYTVVGISPKIPLDWRSSYINTTILGGNYFSLSINHTNYSLYAVYVNSTFKNSSGIFSVRIPLNWTNASVNNGNISSNVTVRGTDKYVEFNTNSVNGLYLIENVSIDDNIENLTLFDNLTPYSILSYDKIKPSNRKDCGSSSHRRLSNPDTATGGGGGGGGASGENYSNIDVREKYYLHIFKDKITSYMFTNSSNPILFINITGNISAGEIVTMVETLKGTSTLVKTISPGIVYKNINMWVGTSGFAVPENIKQATITFRVENSWLSSNNLTSNEIKLIRWDGSRWIDLETLEKMRNGNNTYFEARTDRFSSFAITGIRGVPSVAPPVLNEIQPISAETPGVTITGTPAEPSQINLVLIAGLFILIAAIVALYLRKR